jgi:hypothetical protein
MQIDTQELAAAYMRCSDDELAALAADSESLTDAARAVLHVEIQRRGMSSQQLEKLHSRELHREARFDQVETIRRKGGLFGRTRDWKGWIWAGLIFLVLLLLDRLWSHMRH